MARMIPDASDRPTGDVYCLVVSSPDGEYLAASYADLRIRVWDNLPQEPFAVIEGHAHAPRHLAFSPDRRLLASGAGNSAGQVLKIWDLERARQERLLRSSSADSIAFSRDGKYLASADYQTVRVWDLEKPGEVLRLEMPSGTVDSLSFSPDGQRLAASASSYQLGEKGTRVTIWDTRTGQEQLSLERPSSMPCCVAFSPDGESIVSNIDESLRIWDSTTGHALRTLRASEDNPTGIPPFPALFSPDGDYVLAATQLDGLVLWDAETGREVREFGRWNYAPTAAFSPDGSRMASVTAVSETEGIPIWDVQTGNRLLTLKGHTDDVESVAFSPDGRRLVAAIGDDTVRVWDSSTGHLLLTVSLPAGHSRSVRFAQDGRLAVAGPGGIEIWDSLDWTETGDSGGSTASSRPANDKK